MRAQVIAVHTVKTLSVLPVFLAVGGSIALTGQVTCAAGITSLAYGSFEECIAGKDSKKGTEGTEVFTPEPFFHQVETKD